MSRTNNLLESMWLFEQLVNISSRVLFKTREMPSSPFAFVDTFRAVNDVKPGQKIDASHFGIPWEGIAIWTEHPSLDYNIDLAFKDSYIDQMPTRELSEEQKALLKGGSKILTGRGFLAGVKTLRLRQTHHQRWSPHDLNLWYTRREDPTSFPCSF
jgi:hypothetical protein